MGEKEEILVAFERVKTELEKRQRELQRLEEEREMLTQQMKQVSLRRVMTASALVGSSMARTEMTKKMAKLESDTIEIRKGIERAKEREQELLEVMEENE